MRPLLVMYALVFAALSGCASVGGMRTEPLDVGKARIFRAAPARTFQAARAAFVETQMEVKEITRPDSATWIMIGGQRASFWSYGELVRVLVRPASDSTTEVRVVTKKRMSTNIGAKGDWSGSIFAIVAAELADSGVALPPSCEELGGRSSMGTQNGQPVERCLLPGA